MGKLYCKCLVGFFIFCLSLSSATSFAVDLFDTCTQSVSALEIKIESELAISQAQVDAGFLSGEDHKSLQSALTGIQQKFSLDNCMASRASDLDVYQCLIENDGNHEKCLSSK